MELASRQRRRRAKPSLSRLQKRKERTDRSAAISEHTESCRHRSARARVRAGSRRPHRRNRRGEVDPRRRRRTARGRPRVTSDLVERVRSWRRSKPSSRARTMTSSSCAGRSPHKADAAAPSSTARSTTSAALRELAAPLVDLHGQHEHQVLLDPVVAPRPARRVCRSHRRARARRAGVRRSGSGVTAERAALLTGEREKAARAEFLTFQLQEIDRVAPARRRRRRARRDPAGAGQRRRLQRLCADAYTSLYEG